MPASFSGAFNVDSALSGGGERVHFGTDVLAQLVAGIDGFREDLEGEQRSRSLGPAMLGAFLWVDDPELLDRIASFPASCVVITKQKRDRSQPERTRKVGEAVARAAGFPAGALPDLEHLVLREDGKVPVVGPSWREPVRLSTLRSIGYRKVDQHLVPILHTKMMLLGELWWHDEGPLGEVADVIGFRPHRLWVGSTNGTKSSRSNIEMGMWLEDPALLNAAQDFLVKVIAHSEELDPDSDVPEPDLVEPVYDDEAMAEAMAELDM